MSDHYVSPQIPRLACRHRFTINPRAHKYQLMSGQWISEKQASGLRNQADRNFQKGFEKVREREGCVDNGLVKNGEYNGDQLITK